MRATSMVRFVLFGAAGFSIGWSVAGFLNTIFTAILAPLIPLHSPLPLVEQLPYLTGFFAAAFGGVALGLRLAIIGIHPSRFVAPLVVLVVVLTFSHLLYPCSPDERAVLREFPQYGGREVTDEYLRRSWPDPAPMRWLRWFVAPHPQGGWGCYVTNNESTGAREERIAHYKQQLEEHGWEMGTVRSERGGGGVCCQEFYAYRDGYRYWVNADSIGGPQSDGHLLVEVTRVGLPRPGWI